MDEEIINILYLEDSWISTNFYASINGLYKYNLVRKVDWNELSLESYDGFIINLFIFENKKIDAEKLLKRIYSYNKPTILIYSPEMNIDSPEIKYLEETFGIEFENKDAAIIEKNYEDYIPKRYNDYALSMKSNNGYGKAYIKNTNNCFILKIENITIMNDNEIEFLNIEEDIVIQKEELLVNLLKNNVLIEVPKWANDLKILDESKIEEELSKIEIEINEKNTKKAAIIKELKENRKYKQLLFASGENLVEIVKEVLTEMLNLSINDIDVRKEDLSVELDKKKIMIEVKGINTAIKRNNVSQTQRHIQDDADANNIEDDDEIAVKYKGLLIVNPYIKTPIRERIEKEFYSQTVIKDLKNYNICAIDTITLLSLFQKSRKGETIDLKDIILKSTYVEPDFSAIADNQ